MAASCLQPAPCRQRPAASAACSARPIQPARSLRQEAPSRGGGGRRALAVSAQQQHQQQERQQGAQQQPHDEQQQLGELPDLAPPKFQPFTPHNALRQAMLGFRERTHLPDGRTLLVAPLAHPWLPAAADILTDSFAESLAAQPFKRYLRRQVKAYLEAHIGLPPKAVVLAALLLPPGADAGSSSDEQPWARQLQPLAGSSSAGASSSAGDGSSSSSSASTATSSSSSASSAGSAAAGPQLGLGDGMASGAAMAPPLALDSMLTSSSSSSGSSEEDDAVAAAAMAAAVAAGGGGAAGAVPGSGAELVAVVELSFSASTRSKHLTLKPPESRPYLCNMATAASHRRRGYGYALLRAAERLVCQLGEGEVYLHLRVQDKHAAALYAKAGYRQVAADLFLVRLLGLDQRRLMAKALPRA